MATLPTERCTTSTKRQKRDVSTAEVLQNLLLQDSHILHELPFVDLLRAFNIIARTHETDRAIAIPDRGGRLDALLASALGLTAHGATILRIALAPLVFSGSSLLGTESAFETFGSAPGITLRKFSAHLGETLISTATQDSPTQVITLSLRRRRSALARAATRSRTSC